MIIFQVIAVTIFFLHFLSLILTLGKQIAGGVECLYKF